MIRLSVRTVPVFAVIVGFAMALAAYMNFSGVRTAYLDLIRSRMTMTAGSIATDIVAASTLGIRLTEQRTLPDLLSRQAQADPMLLSLDVTDENGRVAFSSDAARVGMQDPEWTDPAAFRHRQGVVNDFGALVGAVVVRLDRNRIDAQVAGLRRDILTLGLPIGIVAVLAGSLLCVALLTRLHRRARRAWSDGTIDQSIARAASEVDRLATGQAA